MRYPHLFALLTVICSPLSALAASGGAGSSSAAAAASAVPATPIVSTPSITGSLNNSETAPFSEAKSDKGERDGVIPGTNFERQESFHTYVQRSTGRSVGVFGRELFSGVPSTYAPLNAVQVNPDYLVGPGDVLQIRGWGMVEIDVTVAVNRSGEIFLPKVGLVRVAGVRYRDLQGYLKKAVGRMFTNFDLSASISQARSVQVYVVGHAHRPGTYTLSAMSTLLNALFASGGPSSTGSMRNIKVKRVGQPPMTFDLYDMLIYGDKSSDINLQDGDVIYLSEVGPLVALLGDVKRPAIFELNQETSLAEVMGWAGGFDSAVALNNIIVEKNIDSRFQTVAELKADRFSVKEKLASQAVRPSDIIRVFSPSAVALQVKVERQFVRVDGAVKHNGVYEIEKGETLRSLVNRIGGVTDQAYVYATRLLRESVRAMQRKHIDEATERMEKDLEITARQQLSGETDDKKIALLQREYDAERRLIQSIRASKSEGRIVLNLKGADATIAELPDFPLEDGDEVYIPMRSASVDVIGAVFQQNTFMYDPARSPQDYIENAGGVSVTADKSRIFRICADGSIKSRRNGALSGKLNPGEVIVVPEKINKVNRFSLTGFIKDWTAIFYQFGLGAAGLKTLK